MCKWNTLLTLPKGHSGQFAYNCVICTLSMAPTTGRQPPPLYSVLYEIISKRRCILPRNFSLEKNKVPSNIPSLPVGSMKLIWWKLKMSYHTAYPNWDCPAVVCHLFHLFHMCTNNCIPLIVKILHIQLSNVFFTYLGTSPGVGFHF